MCRRVLVSIGRCTSRLRREAPTRSAQLQRCTGGPGLGKHCRIPALLDKRTHLELEDSSEVEKLQKQAAAKPPSIATGQIQEFCAFKRYCTKVNETGKGAVMC